MSMEVLRENAALLGTLESSIRSLTYILPGRFKHSEIVAEGSKELNQEIPLNLKVYGVLNVFNMYLDSILQQGQMSRTSIDERPSIFNQYTRSALKSSKIYAALSYSVTIVQHLQVLAEMIAKELGSDKLRWQVVGIIEFMKLVSRLLVFKLSKRRTILHSQVVERDFDVSQISVDQKATTWTGPRSQKDYARLEGFLDKEKTITNNGVSKYLVSRAILDSAKRPSDYLTELGRLRAAAEWIYIIKPFIYLCSKGKIAATMRRIRKDSDLVLGWKYDTLT
ncbi:Peroxisomal membrane protein pex16 [Dinochytrium kinnereticum]|nr:Peroxisomal membrane protein pex16 [Dinochytrium kinnereticum]